MRKKKERVCAEGQSRTDIACSSDRCLDHLGYLGQQLCNFTILQRFQSSKSIGGQGNGKFCSLPYLTFNVDSTTMISNNLLSDS